MIFILDYLKVDSLWLITSSEKTQSYKSVRLCMWWGGIVIKNKKKPQKIHKFKKIKEKPTLGNKENFSTLTSIKFDSMSFSQNINL